MNSSKKTYLLLAISITLFLPGLFVAVSRCALRITIERQDRFIETVVDFEELRRLAREEGWTLPDLFEAMADHGASSIGISEDTISSLSEEGRISVFSNSEILKLNSLNGISFPYNTQIPRGLGGLWIVSGDSLLLDRIEQHLTWKLSPQCIQRLNLNAILLTKSSNDFQERVGLGFSKEYINLAQKRGLGVVLRLYNYPNMHSETIRRILADIPPPASISAILFAEEEVLGNRGAINSAIEELKRRPYRIGWVEFNDQEGMEKFIHEFGVNYPIRKVHSIGRKEMDQNYNLSRAVARWTRAVRDRRIKMLYIRCFFQDKKKFIGDLVKYNIDYLERIVNKLKSDGYIIPRSDSDRFQEPRHNLRRIYWYESLLMGLSLAMGFLFLLCVSRNSALNPSWAFVVTCTTLLAFALLKRGAFISLISLIGAISFSSLGVILGIRRLNEFFETNKTFSWFRRLPKFLATLIMPSLIGGVLIAGIHTELSYLLKFDQFRGIKLAFLIPLIWVFFWTTKQYGGGFMQIFSRPITFREMFLAGVVLFGTALYLLRSGNITFLKPSEFEDFIRTTLEELLLARPRNKEFLIGYPAVLFFLFFRSRKILGILPVLALFIAMGQVSVLNTFCHFHSPLGLAFLRSFNGLWTGIAVGFCALALYILCRIMSAATQKENLGFLVGYFGYQNLGDEILWRFFINEARKLRPDLKWKLLNHEPNILGDSLENVSPIMRGAYFESLETLAKAKVMVIPGGSVLQASTSSRSLLYYLFYCTWGKIFGARLLLPAQGLGPWEPQNTANNSYQGISLRPTFILVFLARMVLDFADYLSLRDTSAANILADLPSPSLKASVTTDLAFLAEPSFFSSTLETNGRQVVGVILRESFQNSSRIAAFFSQLSQKENIKIKIIPMAFQPYEDERPWMPYPQLLSPRKMYEKMPDKIFSELLDIDILVSMRLHGCILATILGIPWIGLSKDPKITGFAKDIQWNYLIDPSHFEEEIVFQMVQEIFKNLAELKKNISSIYPTKHSVAKADVYSCFEKI